MFGTYVLIQAFSIYDMSRDGGICMREISIGTTAQIYDFSELQRRRQQKELRKRYPIIIIAIIISLLGICFFLYLGDRVVKAKEPTSDIQYKVVQVEEGDSLWSIARENMSKSSYAGYSDIYQYIYEIKKCNNMKTNQINAGCYLMVPYYQ